MLAGVAVFVAVSHWMQRASCKSKQGSRMAEAAEKLAACIRFPMLSNDFLHFVAAQVGGHIHLKQHHCQYSLALCRMQLLSVTYVQRTVLLLQTMCSHVLCQCCCKASRYVARPQCKNGSCETTPCCMQVSQVMF